MGISTRHEQDVQALHIVTISTVSYRCPPALPISCKSPDMQARYGQLHLETC